MLPVVSFYLSGHIRHSAVLINVQDQRRERQPSVRFKFRRGRSNFLLNSHQLEWSQLVQYSDSEAGAKLVCKSVYSGGPCEVISHSDARLKIHREAGISRPEPFTLSLALPLIVSASLFFLCLSYCSTGESPDSSSWDFLSLSHTPLVRHSLGFDSSSGGYLTFSSWVNKKFFF